MSFLIGTPPRVIAHRGLAIEHGENTLGAFGAAVDAGADILETDVHLSKDGEVIIAHDSLLERVAGRSGSIADYTASELAGIDLGSGEGFPTLAQALERFPQQRFNIDLKVDSVVEPFVSLITALGATDRILVASFSELTRSRAVAGLPGVASSATSRHVIEGRLRSWVGLALDKWDIPSEVVALQIPTSYYGLPLVTPGMIRSCHRRGREVHVWTINDVSHMKRLWQMGVDGIVTDRCDLATLLRKSLAASDS
ncbi:MAG: glycerophosphodiester phosphodiesterase [Microbacteriaceae bacterium]